MVIWLPGCLVGLISASEILGLLGLYKVRSGWVVVEFGLSAMWSGYSWVYISCATVLNSLQTNKNVAHLTIKGFLNG